MGGSGGLGAGQWLITPAAFITGRFKGAKEEAGRWEEVVAITQGRKDHVLNLASGRGGERWPDSAYVLEVEPRAYGDGPDVECERRKRHWEGLPDFFYLSDVLAIYQGEDWAWVGFFFEGGEEFLEKPICQPRGDVEWEAAMSLRCGVRSGLQICTWGLCWKYIILKNIFRLSHFIPFATANRDLRLLSSTAGLESASPIVSPINSTWKPTDIFDLGFYQSTSK